MSIYWPFSFIWSVWSAGAEFWGGIASWVARGGFLLQTAALLWRWKSSYDLGIGHVPLANFYESLVFFAWAILLLYLLIEWRTRNRSLGTFVLPVAFLSLAYASIGPGVSGQIQPLVPALQSNWLTVHVLTCFLGYAAFACAFGLGIMFLLKGEGGGVGRPDPASDPGDRFPRGTDLPVDHPGFCPADPRDHDRLRLGPLRLGLLLELGSEGDLVAHHLDRLCRHAPRPFRPRLAGEADGVVGAGRLCLRVVHLPWRQLSRQPPQLLLATRFHALLAAGSPGWASCGRPQLPGPGLNSIRPLPPATAGVLCHMA